MENNELKYYKEALKELISCIQSLNSLMNDYKFSPPSKDKDESIKNSIEYAMAKVSMYKRAIKKYQK